MKVNHVLYCCINVSTILDKHEYEVRFFNKDTTLGVLIYYKAESITFKDAQMNLHLLRQFSCVSLDTFAFR